MSARRQACLATMALLLAACGGDAGSENGVPERPLAAETGPQAEFWNALQQLCGNAYEGELVTAPEGDATFAGQRLVMHVSHCDVATVRIPFHVGENRSRTWVISRTPDGLRLKHDHRHEDGTDDQVTMYGGDSAGEGTATSQEFPADEFTAALIPEARTNFWTIEIMPGRQYVYALRREGTERRFRIEFDLTRTVEEPPPPWGSR
jgi:hypothetical protein